MAAGERVGVTGPVGSGKSTLADVLFGLRAPHQGTIQLDGFDLRDIPLGDLRQSVALVRGIEIFPGSVIDNVRLGREDLSLADVTDALRRVGLHDDVLGLPDGLSTRLHPNGRPLSSRQAWRLMVARAIAGSPRLLVIDGVLDHIDASQDRDALLSMIVGADAPWTLVCITDAPDLLARCSRVITLEGGQVRERQRQGEVQA